MARLNFITTRIFSALNFISGQLGRYRLVGGLVFQKNFEIAKETQIATNCVSIFRRMIEPDHLIYFIIIIIMLVTIYITET